MTYNNKKVGNKYAIIFISFLLFLSSMLAVNPAWLNKFYGETLCASQSAPVLDSSYFNYKDSNFLNKFDFACTDLVSMYTGSSPNIGYKLTILNDDATSVFTTSLTYTNIRSMLYYGPSNIGTSYEYYFNRDYYFVPTGGFTAARFTYYSNYGYYFNQFDLASTEYAYWLSNLDFVYYWARNNTYYVGMSASLYNKYLAYQDGLADADTDTAYQNGYNAGQSDGYNSGYSAGNSAGITTGQNNVINNPNNYDLYTQQQYDAEYQRGYQIGQDDILVNPNSYGLYTQSQYDNNYQSGYNAGIIAGQNNVINNPNDYDLYNQSQYDNNYQDGYTAGQQSSTNYQDGYTAGQTDGINDVINNPNNYDLYTQQQYDAEYQRGYQAGLDYASTLYDGYGNFLYSKFYWTEFSDKYTPLVYTGVNSSNYVLSGEFSNYTNLFDKLPGGFSISDNYVAMITDLDGNEYLNMDNTILWFEFYNGVSVDKFPSIVVPGSQRLGSDYFVEFINGTILSFNGADVVFDGIDLSSYTGNYIKRVGIGTTRIQDYFNSSDGLAFNTRDSYTYQLGYSEGNKAGYSEGNKAGYDAGYGEGRSDGIISASENNFTSLIMAVVDAPINMFKSLFNFNILGFNLLGFATGIFTLCVFIFIIKKFIGK